MFNPQQLQQAIDALKRRRVVGPDIQPEAVPNFPAPVDDGGGVLGGIIRGAGEGAAAAIRRPQQQQQPAPPKVTFGPDQAAIGLDKAVRGVGGPPAPFVNPSKAARVPRRFATDVPLYGGGGTLDERNRLAIVGDEGPELAVRDGKRTHIVPLDLSKLDPAHLEASLRPTPSQNAGAQQQPAAPPSPSLPPLEPDPALVGAVRGQATPAQTPAPPQTVAQSPLTAERMMPPVEKLEAALWKRGGVQEPPAVRPRVAADSNNGRTYTFPYNPQPPDPNGPPRVTRTTPEPIYDTTPDGRQIEIPRADPNVPLPEGQEWRPDPKDPSLLVSTPKAAAKQSSPFADVSEETAEMWRSHLRKRVADPIGRIESQLDYEESHPATDQNGGWKSAALGALISGVDAIAKTGDWRAGVGAAGAGAVAGGIDHSFDERLQQQYRVDANSRRLEAMRKRQDARLEADDKRASTRQKNAAAAYHEARPDLEEKRIAAQAGKRKQDLIKAEIATRLKEPRAFDTSNPYDAGLLQRASEAGVSFAAGAMGDYKNPAKLEILDPNDPTKKTVLAYNRETQTFEPTGYQTGHTQPVNSDSGMTNYQEKTVELSGARLDETKRHNSVTENLQAGEYARRVSNDLNSQAKRVFDIETKGLDATERRLLQDINTWTNRKAKAEVMPATADAEVSKLQAQLSEVRTKMDAARSKALSGSSSAPASAPSSGGKYKGLTFKRSSPKYAKMRAALPGKTDAEIEQLIMQQGGKVID